MFCKPFCTVKEQKIESMQLSRGEAAAKADAFICWLGRKFQYFLIRLDETITWFHAIAL